MDNNERKKSTKTINKFTAVKDLLFCIAALCVMNGVLQLVVYPFINRTLGADKYGQVLYLLGVLAIFTPAFGSAVNNSRLVERNKYEVKNGDANTTLLIFGIVGFIISSLLIVFKSDGIITIILWFPLFVFTLIKYYADVEFRLNINYKRYFIYYLILSVFYLFGLFAFNITGIWCFAFLFGEIAAVCYVFLKGTIFKKAFQKSDNFLTFFKSALILALSYLVSHLIMNADRLILSHFVGNAAVSTYYVSSLIGKTVAILSTSFNSVIIGYLTKSKLKIDNKMFLKIVLSVFLIGILITFVFLFITPIFISLFYPDLLNASKQVYIFAVIAQIEFMLSGTLLVITLTFSSAKWQLALQLIYGILFVSLGSYAAYKGGLPLFSKVVLGVNTLRLVLVALIGFYNLKKENSNGSIRYRGTS